MNKKRDATPLEFRDDRFELAPPEFLSNFIDNHAVPTQHDEHERSWYFDEKLSSGPGESIGYVHYGTFGFESDFVSTRTGKKNYRRQVDDVEEIPLFYEFWCPPGVNYGLAAFQSFQGRSCIRLVMEALEKAFESANPGYLFRFRKLLPNDGGTLYSTAPVKQLRLIRRKAPSDITDRYLSGEIEGEVDFEVSLTARRRQKVGEFGSISRKLKQDQATGLVLHEGIEFNEAVALIRVGKKYRPVGVFGINTDAGVIDITEDVVRGADGHPTFESLRTQSNEILKDLSKSIGNK